MFAVTLDKRPAPLGTRTTGTSARPETSSKGCLVAPVTSTASTQTPDPFSSRIQALEFKLKKANSKIRYYHSKGYLRERMADFLAAKAITPATARKIISGKRPKTTRKTTLPPVPSCTVSALRPSSSSVRRDGCSYRV